MKKDKTAPVCSVDYAFAGLVENIRDAFYGICTQR